jgi:hypothetical protein
MASPDKTHSRPEWPCTHIAFWVVFQKYDSCRWCRLRSGMLHSAMPRQPPFIRVQAGGMKRAS